MTRTGGHEMEREPCYGREVPRGLPKFRRRRHLPVRHSPKKKAPVRGSRHDWQALRALVLARPLMGAPGTAGPCERCGERLATDPHHRILRSEGGRDVASN